MSLSHFWSLYLYTLQQGIKYLVPVVQMVKRLPTVWETWLQSLGGEDPLEEGHGSPLQYSCLENPVDGGAWWASVHGAARNQTQLSDFPNRAQSAHNNIC